MKENKRLKIWIVVLSCLLVIFGAYLFYLEFNKDVNSKKDSKVNEVEKDKDESNAQKISWYTPTGTANKISRISKKETLDDTPEIELWEYEGKESNYYHCDVKDCYFEELINGTNLAIINDGGKVVYNPAINKAFKYEFEEDNSIPIIDKEKIVAYLVFKIDSDYGWLREYAIYNVKENKYVSDYSFTAYTTDPVMVKDGKVILERNNWEPCVVNVNNGEILKLFEEHNDLWISPYNEDNYYLVASEYDPQGDFPTIDSIYNNKLEYLNITGETYIENNGTIFSLEGNIIKTYNSLGKVKSETKISGEIIFSGYKLFTFVRDVDNYIKVLDNKGNVMAVYDKWPYEYQKVDNVDNIYRLNSVSRNSNQDVIIEIYLPTNEETEYDETHEGYKFKKYTFNTSTYEKNVSEEFLKGW